MLNFAVRSPAQNAQSIVTKGTEVLGLGDPANPTLVSSMCPVLDVTDCCGRGALEFSHTQL